METVKRVIRMGNRTIAFGFNKKTIAELNRLDHTGLKKVHIFLLSEKEAEGIPAKSAGILARDTEKRGVTTVIHCGDQGTLAAAKRSLRDIPEGAHFRVSLMNQQKPPVFSCGDGGQVVAWGDGKMLVSTESRGNIVVQWIIPDDREKL